MLSHSDYLAFADLTPNFAATITPFARTLNSDSPRRGDWNGGLACGRQLERETGSKTTDAETEGRGD